MYAFEEEITEERMSVMWERMSGVYFTRLSERWDVWRPWWIEERKERMEEWRERGEEVNDGGVE